MRVVANCDGAHGSYVDGCCVELKGSERSPCGKNLSSIFAFNASFVA